MTPTANADLFLCKIERHQYIPEFNESIPYYDCSIEINPKGGYTFRQFDILPYRIKIRSKERYPRDYGTFVEKASELVKDMHFEGMEPFIRWKEVFHTLEEIELPWNDRDKCLEKIKKLTVFS